MDFVTNYDFYQVYSERIKQNLRMIFKISPRKSEDILTKEKN